MKTALLLFVSAWLHPAADAQWLSNRGTDFWVGYGHHQYMEPGQSTPYDMVLYLSAEQAATVTVTTQGPLSQIVTTYNVPANSTITTATMPKSGSTDVRLYSPPVAVGGNGGEGIFGRSIHIQSNVPIVAYAHIYAAVSSGATLLLPTNTWGLAYTSINSEQLDAGGPAASWMYVIASEDSTVVEITPSAVSRLGKPAGVPFTVTLNKGQIYQLMGQADGNGNGVQLTGTTVRSLVNSAGVRNRIAVFSGSSRTRGESIPCGTGSGRDNDMQQALPAHAWGTRYLTAPFSSAGTPAVLLPNNPQTSVYKIVARWPNTIVRRNGVVLPPDTRGWWSFASNQPELIEATQPVMVGQFMSGSNTCNPGNLGDPEMVFLTPLDQGIKATGFFRNNQTAIAANFLTVILPAAGLPSLRVDGSSSLDLVYDHPQLAGYKVAVKGWAAQQVSARVQSDSGFTALTYGLGSAESYGYNAGIMIRNLDAQTALLYGAGLIDTNTTINAGSTFRLALRSPHRLTRITWHSAAIAGLSPAGDATLNNPVPSDSVMINGRMWYNYLSDSTYTATVPGTYTFPVDYAHPLLEVNGQGLPVLYTLTISAGTATALGNPTINPDGFSADNVVLSPNPARGNVQIRYAGRNTGALTATLYSSDGTAVGKPVAFTGNQSTIALSGLPQGVYFVVLTDQRSRRVVYKKLVKI